MQYLHDVAPRASVFLVGLFAFTFTQAASLLEGKWQTANSFGSLEYDVLILETSTGALQAQIENHHPNNAPCLACKGKYAGKPLKGAVLVSGLMQVPGNPKKYTGNFYDVYDGKTYPVSVKIINNSLYVKTKGIRKINQLWKPRDE